MAEGGTSSDLSLSGYGEPAQPVLRGAEPVTPEVSKRVFMVQSANIVHIKV